MPLDLTVWDDSLALQLGLDSFTAGIFLSSIFLIMFLIPTIYATRGRGALLPSIMVGFPVLGFCIAIGWMPYYFLLIISMIIALMFAGQARGAISGD